MDGTVEDFSELLKLAHDRSAEGRRLLIRTITDLFSERRAVLTNRERNLMSDILGKLIGEVETEIRRELAERLVSLRQVPRSLIVALANDEIEVARPILLESDVLTDPELIEIVQLRTREHQLAIAMRHSVSEIVSDALVETGDTDVIKTLLQNENAKFTLATIEYLVEQARRVDSYQEPLVRRKDLGPELAQRLYWWVSAALRKHILANYQIDQTALDDQIEEVVTGIAGRLTQDKPAPGKVPATRAQVLAQHLAKSQELKPPLLIRTLRQGEVALFEALFAQMVSLPLRQVQRLVYGCDGKDLAIACRALEIRKADFSALVLLVRKGMSDNGITDPKEFSRTVHFFESINPEGAKRVLRQWQRNPAYLDAIDRVQTPGGADDRS